VEDGESQLTALAGQGTSGNILRFYHRITQHTHTPLPSNYRLYDRKRRRRATNFSHPLTPARCSEEEGGDKKEEEIKKPTSQDGLIAGAGDLLEDEGSWNAGGLEGEEEDLLRGLCPEDLSFSLNTSHCPQTIPVGPSSIPGDGGTECGQDSGHIPPSPVCVKMGEERVEEEESSFFGLPPLVKSLLKENRGICQLYAWQKECLCLPRVLDGGNLLYSLPTGGGKTLVAEILILRQLLLLRRDVLLILPYVSLVQEKVRELTAFALALEFVVEEYAGGRGKTPPIRRRRKKVVYVATIEKASGLINSLAETGQLDSLGLVVVDEVGRREWVSYSGVCLLPYCSCTCWETEV
jgi:hypothetical protein